jgi:hypothetical protein
MKNELHAVITNQLNEFGIEVQGAAQIGKWNGQINAQYRLLTPIAGNHDFQITIPF